MPEKKLTRAKLGAHLRRCGLIYLAGAIALIFLNNLIFTMTRPRVPDEETVRVMVVNQNADFTQQKQALYEAVHAADETVRALDFEVMWYDSDQYELGMAMPVKLMAGGYDLLVGDEKGFDGMRLMGALAPLDDYLSDEAGERIELAEAETGETHVMAIKTDLLGMKDVYVGLSANSDNPQSAWNAYRVFAEMKGEA